MKHCDLKVISSRPKLYNCLRKAWTQGHGFSLLKNIHFSLLGPQKMMNAQHVTKIGSFAFLNKKMKPTKSCFWLFSIHPQQQILYIVTFWGGNERTFWKSHPSAIVCFFPKFWAFHVSFPMARGRCLTLKAKKNMPTTQPKWPIFQTPSVVGPCLSESCVNFFWWCKNVCDKRPRCSNWTGIICLLFVGKNVWYI